METESIAPTGPTYEHRTLTDPASGIKVSGYFTGDAALVVKDRLLHVKGSCEVCDDIRAREDKGELIVLYDIGLSSGSYTGDLIVEIPVDAKYNGQTVLFLHCKDKVLESRTLTVENGMAKGTFSGLFALRGGKDRKQDRHHRPAGCLYPECGPEHKLDARAGGRRLEL